MNREILRIILPHHPLLGRNVNHDSESWRYRVPPPPQDLAFTSVRHHSFIDILDQGNLGSCTGHAGCSCVYHEPYVDAADDLWTYGHDEAGAVALYSAATQIDPYAGEYPPDDTGSDGLSIAKVLKAKGIISGYLWAFTLDEALARLERTPVIIGVPWFNSMFTTTDDGHAGHVLIQSGSGLAGGHELCMDELVVGTRPDRSDWFVGGPNSWDTSWGDGGRWYWTVPELSWLLTQDGDVTAFEPATAPAPTPTPVPGDPAGDLLWSRTRSWAKDFHIGGNARAAQSLLAWGRDTRRP